MDPSILIRVLPALLAATAVTRAAARPRPIGWGAALDQVLRAGFVAVVAGRAAWLLLAGPDVWRTMGATVLLLRAGVEPWLGAAVATGWILRQTRDDVEERDWLLRAVAPATLAGLAVWHGTCAVESVCAGIPVAWGVRLPGYLSPVVPVGYLEAVVAGVLAVLAWRSRTRLSAVIGVLAWYAATRVVLGFVKAPLVGLPSRDQILSAVAAVVLGGLAVRLRGHRTDEGRGLSAGEVRP